MQLSKRMQMIADMVKPADCIADIGTDHGYIPIWLAEHGITEHVIAADVRKGPLSRAQEHVREHGLQERIELRLGDGLRVLSPGEADRIIISGMGGLLMIEILSDCPEIASQTEELILSPQSDIDAVRRYLHDIGFRIESEDMTVEDGKYYTVMRCRHGKDCIYAPEDYLYGRIIIDHSHPVLADYLNHKIQKTQEIICRLTASDTEKSKKRIEELEQETSLMRAAIMRMRGAGLS